MKIKDMIDLIFAKGMSVHSKQWNKTTANKIHQTSAISERKVKLERDAIPCKKMYGTCRDSQETL